MTATHECSPDPDVAVGETAEVRLGGTLTCVFAVCERPDPSIASGCEGHVGAAAPYLLSLGGGLGDGGLWALAQEVPAAQFSEEALRTRFAHQAELEACARSHHAMVTAAAAAGPIVPLPLATLFTDRDRAREVLDGRREQFRAVFDRVRGRAEWAVKVYTVPPAASRRDDSSTAGVTASADARTAQTAASGRAYLDRVRTRQVEREAKQDAALTAAARVDEAIGALALDAVRRRPHGPEITGRHRTQILNAAYLVDESRTRELHVTIAALQGDPGTGALIEVSGPWVPYSFAGSDGA